MIHYKFHYDINIDLMYVHGLATAILPLLVFLIIASCTRPLQ